MLQSYTLACTLNARVREYCAISHELLGNAFLPEGFNNVKLFWTVPGRGRKRLIASTKFSVFN